MKIYIPTVIETAEQADALPDGAILFDVDIADGCIYYHDRDSGEWYVDGYPGTLSRAIQFGCTVTALVPVEAEEQWGRTTATPGPVLPIAHPDDTATWRVRGYSIVTRLVTPWEPVEP